MDFLSAVLPFLIFAVLMYFVLRSTTKRSRAAISESMQLQKEQLEQIRQIASLQKEHNELLKDWLSRTK